MKESLNVVILGLSITSSRGNGHAGIYRGLARELNARGHRILFLERNSPWYSEHRDMPDPEFCRACLYSTINDLKDEFAREIREADLVMVGSFVSDGVVIGEWVRETARGVTAFYDLDPSVTLSLLNEGRYDYLSPDLVSGYDLYLSIAGGGVLDRLENEFGSPMARPLYGSVDANLFYPDEQEIRCDVGYIGSYRPDRQSTLESLLIESAKGWKDGRFSVVGPHYPDSIVWPGNVERIDHLPWSEHRRFYNEHRFALIVTRADMVEMGWSPSGRLFEAAACGRPIISDWWDGLGHFLIPGEEILISHGPEETLWYLRDLPEEKAMEVGRQARQTVLSQHTAAHRAMELENYISESLGEREPENRSPAESV